MKHLNKEEKELLESYKKSQWKSVKKQNIKIYEKATKNSILINKDFRSKR
jgi:hypothetical protein